MTLRELITKIEQSPQTHYNNGITIPQSIDRYKKPLGVSFYIIEEPTTKEYLLLQLNYLVNNKVAGKNGLVVVKEDFIVYRAYYSDNDIEPFEFNFLNYVE